ncbi:hypothetical protein DAI22_02g278500 [Oryza sativa Japonica Group]|nr:hypothetical protein DAI22_02g278500 [Oryza sativa Japonica Group]
MTSREKGGGRWAAAVGRSLTMGGRRLAANKKLGSGGEKGACAGDTAAAERCTTSASPIRPVSLPAAPRLPSPRIRSPVSILIHPIRPRPRISSPRPPLAPIPILRAEVAPGVLLLPPHRLSPVTIPPSLSTPHQVFCVIPQKSLGVQPKTDPSTETGLDLPLPSSTYFQLVNFDFCF